MKYSDQADSLSLTRQTMLDHCFIFPSWKSLHSPAVRDLTESKVIMRRLFGVLQFVCRLIDNPEYDAVIAPSLGCPPEQIARIRALQKPEQSFLYKWDLIESATGLQSLEIDLGADLGGMIQADVHRVLDHSQVLGKGLCPAAAFIGSIKEKLDQLGSHGPVCLLDSPDFFQSYQKYYLPISKYYEKLLGRKCIYMSIDQLEFGETVTYNNEPIDAFLEITCFKDLLDQKSSYAEQYEQAVTSGKVISLVDPYCALLAGKGFFVLLHDLSASGLLPDDLAATVGAFIPETFFVSKENYKRLLTDQQNWVIKHTEGMGGNAVVAGWDVSPSQWKDAAGIALDSRAWIAQRRVSGTIFGSVICDEDDQRRDIVGTRILALFGLDQQLIGGHVRAGTGAVINATSGAGIGVLRFCDGVELAHP